MLILVVDTATDHLLAALAEGETLRAERVLPSGQGSSAQLTRVVDDLCKETGIPLSSVDLLAVTVGPGAFTGLRVGIGFVQGVAYALDRPVVPLSTLQCLAATAPPGDFPVLPLIDARKGEVYAGLFSPPPLHEPLIAETVLPPDRLVSIVSPPVVLIGSGAIANRDRLIQDFGTACRIIDPLPTPSIAPLLPLILRRHHAGESIPPALLSPHYLRRPEAETAAMARERKLH